MKKIIAVGLFILMAVQARALTFQMAPGTQVTPLPTLSPVSTPRVHRHRVRPTIVATPWVGTSLATPIGTPIGTPVGVPILTPIPVKPSGGL